MRELFPWMHEREKEEMKENIEVKRAREMCKLIVTFGGYPKLEVYMTRKQSV